MGKAVVWHSTFFLILLCLKTLCIFPVCGWLLATPRQIAGTVGGRQGRRQREDGQTRWFLPPGGEARGRVIRPTKSSPLYSKKKSGSSSSATAGSGGSTKKVQVKLLQNVPGTGQAGEVILVTPAFFNNKLLPTHLAKMISDEQVELERQAKNAKEQAVDARAVQLKAQIEALPALVMRRKVGPNGQLFGGVGPKMIMDLLGAAIPDEFWTQQKGVKITAMMMDAGDDGPTKITGDIKSVGSYRATIALTKAHSATLQFVIAAEES